MNWSTMWQQLHLTPPLTLVDELNAAYSQPHRYYHKLQHLQECLTLLAQLQHLAIQQVQIALALYFHDAIYDVYANDNEAQSAAWAAKVLADIGAESKLISRIDTLIMATGSRPFIPENAQLHLPGRFTIRKKNDADRLKDYLEGTNLPAEEQHVVIVGGGLLGLELAAALKHKKVKITIIQKVLIERSSSFVISAENAKEGLTAVASLTGEEIISICMDQGWNQDLVREEPNIIIIAEDQGDTIIQNKLRYDTRRNKS